MPFEGQMSNNMWSAADIYCEMPGSFSWVDSLV